MTMSRTTAAHSMTKMWEMDVRAWRDRSRRQRPPRRRDGHVHGGVAFHATRPAPLSAWRRAASRIGRAQEQPEPQRHEHDHDRAAHELGQRELPAEEEGQDDAELDDEVGGGDLEDHGGGEARTLAEQRPGQGHRRVGARRRGRPEPVATARVAGPSSPRSRSTVLRRTTAWITEARTKPRIRAHRISHVIDPVTSRAWPRACRRPHRLVLGRGHGQQLAQAVLEQGMGERRRPGCRRRRVPPCGRSPAPRCGACAARRTRRRR